MIHSFIILAFIVVAGIVYAAIVPPSLIGLIGLVVWMVIVGAVVEIAFMAGGAPS
jgi:hypothetical protein